MRDEIVKIKKEGHLVALQTGELSGWEYWLLNNCLYSISTDYVNVSYWCSVEKLDRHLHRLWQVTGKRHFTENTDMVILDTAFISRFRFA